MHHFRSRSRRSSRSRSKSRGSRSKSPVEKKSRSRSRSRSEKSRSRRSESARSGSKASNRNRDRSASAASEKSKGKSRSRWVIISGAMWRLILIWNLFFPVIARAQKKRTISSAHVQHRQPISPQNATTRAWKIKPTAYTHTFLITFPSLKFTNKIHNNYCNEHKTNFKLTTTAENFRVAINNFW